MAAFCDAQLRARARDARGARSPGADFRDAELGRLTAMRADIEKKMEKFRDAELRRGVEQAAAQAGRERRTSRETGVASGRASPGWRRGVSELLTADAPRSETPPADTPPGRDADGFDAGGFGGGLRRASRESRESANRRRGRGTVREEDARKAALPGASAVGQGDRLPQSAVEKTAEGFSDIEGLAPDAPPPPPAAPGRPRRDGVRAPAGRRRARSLPAPAATAEARCPRLARDEGARPRRFVATRAVTTPRCAWWRPPREARSAGRHEDG